MCYLHFMNEKTNSERLICHCRIKLVWRIKNPVVWNLGFILTFSIWHNPCQTKSIEHYHYVRSKQIAIRKQKRRGAHPESYWSLKCGDVTATSRDCWMTRFRWRAVQWGCASSALTPLCCRPETDQSQYHWTKRKNQKISDLQVKRL